MTTPTEPAHLIRSDFHTLKFTPAEWRAVLEDRSFLEEPDNSYAPMRRLMGMPVVIVPGHDLA